MAKTERIKLTQTARWLDADMETPISLYLKNAGAGEGILLESAEVDGRWGRFSILACNMMLVCSCKNGNLELDIRHERLAGLSAHAGKPFMEGMRAVLNTLEIAAARPDMPPITRALYGYLGFGMASVFNPRLQKIMPLEEAACELALPSTVIVFDHLYNRLCQLDIGAPGAENTSASAADTFAIDFGKMASTPDEAGYKQFVRGIKEMLRQGEAIQVVPSVRFCAPFRGSPFALYRRIRRFNPSPYMFYMRFKDITLLGSSPEVMTRCAGGALELSPIAGTRPRGATPEEDSRLAAELLADPKDCAEHVMLVDLGRNDLGAIARPGSVRLKEYMQIQRFSHVMHMTSEVTAILREKTPEGRRMDALDALAATFPAGTVSGAPKIRAMEIIRELEGQARGPYAGCIGWIGLDHDSVNFDMGITIRSIWVREDRLCWQAGGGIVHDSDPDMEWKEVRSKSAIMRLALNMENEENVSAYR